MPPDFFISVLDSALAEVAAKAVPIYTFAFYHDHESAAVSVCVDTEDSSRRAVAASNQYSMRYFARAVADRDLKTASLWQVNTGRSFSLGDFALVNIARTPLDQSRTDEAFYLAMVQALMSVGPRVAALAPDPERLVFACSGADNEVSYVWSLPTGT